MEGIPIPTGLVEQRDPAGKDLRIRAEIRQLPTLTDSVTGKIARADFCQG